MSQNTSIQIRMHFISKLSPATTPTPEGFCAASDLVVISPGPPSRFLSHPSAPQQVQAAAAAAAGELKAAKPKPCPGNSAAEKGSHPASSHLISFPNIFKELPFRLLGAVQLAERHAAKCCQMRSMGAGMRSSYRAAAT